MTFIPALIGAGYSWGESKYARLFLIYPACLVGLYAITEGLLGTRQRFQAAFLIVWAQFHFAWKMMPAVVHQVHAFAFHQYSPWHTRWLYSTIERLVARHCDRLLFVNSEVRDVVIQRGWLPAADCQTIYNGADLEAVNPRHVAQHRQVQRAQWQADSDEIIILVHGPGRATARRTMLRHGQQ